MSSYLLFAVLLGLAGLTSAIKCYLGTPDGQGKVQNTTECPGKFCVIVHPKPNIHAPPIHGCDIFNACKNDGCTSQDEADATLCCCSYELCNSSSMLVALPAVATIVFSKLMF
ncbi:hypothetical protein RB195_009172 [Necator americanus]|uniref:ET module n=1 Tax=Necator americanus TaxID=51031 RepID=A0ABR1CS53_NECAM